MKIGLMGFEFESPNKGCEALTYSILNIFNNIKQLDENIEITNFSGTGLGEIPSDFPKFKFIDVKPKLKDITFKYLRELKKCDYIFDVTMGDSFSDIYSKKRFDKLIIHKILAEKFCENYILLPQTYGPFYNKNSEKKAIKVFNKAKKIYCRDDLSKKILEDKYNITGVNLASDMAFILPYNKEAYKFNNNSYKIGINVSGLLYKGGFDEKNQFNLKLNYKEFIEQVIEKFLNYDQVELYLIPHVIDESINANDDDYNICKKIKEKYNKCILAPKFKTPIEAKSYISNMDVFIGSRMHSTIAAFSSNVVTIPVSYSRKFEGLFNTLNYNFGINGKEEDNLGALNKLCDYMNSVNKLKSQQNKSLELINKKNEEFIKSIEKIFM